MKQSTWQPSSSSSSSSSFPQRISSFFFSTFSFSLSLWSIFFPPFVAPHRLVIFVAPWCIRRSSSDAIIFRKVSKVTLLHAVTFDPRRGSRSAVNNLGPLKGPEDRVSVRLFFSFIFHLSLSFSFNFCFSLSLSLLCNTQKLLYRSY